MANIIDYLDWRGDLTFEQTPFNEVDNLILACLSYIDYEGVVSVNPADMFITLSEAYEILKTTAAFQKPVPLLSFYPQLLTHAAKSIRFRDIRLSHYVNAIDHVRSNQFSATTFTYGKNAHYIAFRGTDDNLAGWKEDFLMGFSEAVLAQTQAVRYVAASAAKLRGSIILGGHSKGGNLAVYAAVMSLPKIRKRLAYVFNNDGPGFLPSFFSNSGYRDVQGRIVTILPQFSVVGMLLEHGGDYKIVGSTERSIMAHNALTWEVLGPFFVYKKELSKQSRQFSDTLHAWLAQLTLEQRGQFVEALFDIINASGARTLSDLSKDGWAVVDATIKKFWSMDKKTRDLLRDTTMAFFSIRQRMLIESLGEDFEAMIVKKS